MIIRNDLPLTKRSWHDAVYIIAGICWTSVDFTKDVCHKIKTKHIYRRNVYVGD